MKPVYIVGDNLRPLFEYCDWVGTNREAKLLANAICLNKYNGNLSYFYLIDNVVDKFIINGKAVKVDIDKILTLISITDNPLDVISQYINIEN